MTKRCSALLTALFASLMLGQAQSTLLRTLNGLASIKCGKCS